MAKKKNSLPKFKKPPLIEVVIGMQLKPLRDVRVAYIGAFWELLGKENFSRIEEQPALPPLHAEPGIIFYNNHSEWPRIWFIDKNENTLVQLQQDRFIFNWKKSDTNEYPHFEKVHADFIKYYSKLNQWVTSYEENPPSQVEALELTYINHIPYSLFENNLGQINRFFKDLKWEANKRWLNPPEAMSLAWKIPIPELKTAMRVNLQTAQRITDGETVIKFELSIQGRIEESYNSRKINNWFQTSHEWIVRSFTDLTTDHAHKVWERLV